MRISELEEEARQLRARVKQLEAENLALKRAPASSHQYPSSFPQNSITFLAMEERLT